MPVPSNPQDLINIIREKLFNNTSGLIEEPDLREVLENIVKVLDAKFSMFSPNLTEEQYAQWNLILDYMAKETKGVLSPTSPAPTEKGKYLLSSAGTYANLGGLVAAADKLNYAYFDGTTWSLIAVDMPITNYNTGELLPRSINKAETGKSISDAYPKEYQSDNLFDYTTITEDYYVDSEGSLSPASGWFYSDKIQVEVGKTYMNSTGLAGAFYDSNNNFIAPRIPASQYEFIAPANAVYFRTTAPLADVETKILTKGKEFVIIRQRLKNETGQKTISKKLLPPSVLSRKGNNLVVSIRGGGDFRFINDALDWLRNSGENDIFNPFTFEIIDGEYVESVNMCGLYLSLIGRNRENCVIKTYTNDYYNPPIDMGGNNHLQNLTIIADDDGVTTPAGGVNNMPAYGIHFDISSRYESLGAKVQGRSIVKNCRVIAKHQHAVGQGLWTDEYSEWEDCEFYAPNTTAFRTHSYLPAGATNQQFFMRNCRVWNNGTQPPIVVQDANLAGGNDSTDTVYTFQENTFWNDNGASAGNTLLWTHDLVGAGTLSGRIKLGKGSFGNNIPRLNF